MKNENRKAGNTLFFSCRESLIKTNADLISNLQKRISVKRFRPQEGDSIKLGYIRALIQALQVQNSILKDSEIDELKTEIEELREMLENERYRT
jgi:hypothetical protein